jgi:hypothetical protein
VIEALMVLTAVVALGVAGLVLPLLPAAGLATAGIFCAACGLLLGLPTGFWYHVKLRACLSRRGQLPHGWWLRPVALHGQLVPTERPVVLLWFYLGGAGFVLSVLGCGLVIFGVFLQGFRAGVF